MKRHSSLSCALRLMLLFIVAGSQRVSAQEGAPAGYVLYRVATGPIPFDGTARSPISLHADAEGGRAVVHVAFLGDCREDLEYTWEFDKDIRFLKPDETLTITLAGRVGGDCGREPFSIVNTGVLATSIMNTLSEGERNGMSSMQWAIGQTEGEARMHLKTEGTGASVLKAVGGARNAEYLWFAVNLIAISPAEGFTWQIAYLYRRISATEPGGNVPIQLDSPRQESSTSATIPGRTGSAPDSGAAGSGTTGGVQGAGTAQGAAGAQPGQQTSGASCLDPALQACIDEWLRGLVEILNRNAADRAPWGISPYGHLLNNQVRSFAAPDGWDTKYQSSKYCFVWQEYARFHEDTIVRGQLTPLHDFCGAAGAGGATTGAAGGGGAGGGGSGGDGSQTGGPTNTRSDSAVCTLFAAMRVVESGQRVQIPVRILNPGGLVYINFEISYDSSVVAAMGVQLGGALPRSTLFASNTSEVGRIRIGWVDLLGLWADGTVAEITFNIVGRPGDRTRLKLKVLDAGNGSGQHIPVTVVDGGIVIQGAGVALPGDCDGDGIVTPADALCVLQTSVGLRPENNALDVTGDHKVTSGDARMILEAAP